MFSQLEKCIGCEDFDVTLDEGVEVIPYMVSSPALSNRNRGKKGLRLRN